MLVMAITTKHLAKAEACDGCKWNVRRWARKRVDDIVRGRPVQRPSFNARRLR